MMPGMSTKTETKPRITTETVHGVYYAKPKPGRPRNRDTDTVCGPKAGTWTDDWAQVDCPRCIAIARKRGARW